MSLSQSPEVLGNHCRDNDQERQSRKSLFKVNAPIVADNNKTLSSSLAKSPRFLVTDILIYKNIIQNIYYLPDYLSTIFLS